MHFWAWSKGEQQVCSPDSQCLEYERDRNHFQRDDSNYTAAETHCWFLFSCMSWLNFIVRYKVHKPNAALEKKLITLMLMRKQWKASRAFLIFFFSWKPASSFEILTRQACFWQEQAKLSHANWHLIHFIRCCRALSTNAILTTTKNVMEKDHFQGWGEDVAHTTKVFQN